MRKIYVDRKGATQEVANRFARGSMAIFLARMGMMLCGADQAETINKMILLRLAKRHGNKNWLGKYYPRYKANMDNDGMADSFKGLNKKLSHLLLPKDVGLWARDEYVGQFMKNSPHDAPVVLRFSLNKGKLPDSLRESGAANTIFTDEIQGMVVGSGPLNRLVRVARERNIYLVGTSANFAGEPTIIDAEQLYAFANSLTGVDRMYLDYGVVNEAKARRGLDSASILRPTGVVSAQVLRKAIDWERTKAAYEKAGITLVDAPNCVETTIAEQKRTK